MGPGFHFALAWASALATVVAVHFWIYLSTWPNYDGGDWEVVCFFWTFISSISFVLSCMNYSDQRAR